MTGAAEQPGSRLAAHDDREALLAAAVPRAAEVSGGRGDAVVRLDLVEHHRRRAAGLGAVTDLSVLNALMNLPLNAAVPCADLGPSTRTLLDRAPAGCLQWPQGGQQVRRLVRPVARIPLVIVPAKTWRPGLRRAAAFEPFATRVVLLAQAPRRGGVESIAWEADVAGVGLWITIPDGPPQEIVAPQRWVEHYVKPAGWRFTERAYAAWLAVADPDGPDPPLGVQHRAPARPRKARRRTPPPGQTEGLW